MLKSKKFYWFIFGLFFSLFFALNANSSFHSLSQNHVFPKKLVNKKILKNQKITQEFTALENNLGMIAVRFELFNRLNHDFLIFRIKKKGDKNWVNETIYDTTKFYISSFFSFGFPPIANSKGKTYIFQIESQRGNLGNSVAINFREPNFRTYYQVSGPTFILKKIYNSVSKPQFAPIIFIFFLPFLVNIVWPLIRNHKPLKINKVTLFIIMIIGIIARLILAKSGFNEDIFLFTKYAQKIALTDNIYTQLPAYNYSPLFFYVLKILNSINKLIVFVPMDILIRLCLTLIDLGIFLILLRFNRIAGILFFLSPVVIIITGYHGQIENIPILFLLLSLLFIKNKALAWLFASLGLIFKHNIVFQVLLIFLRLWKHNVITLGFFAISVGLFLVTFVPYFSDGKNEIVNRVFAYGAMTGLYGVSKIVSPLKILSEYRFVFMLMFFAFTLWIKKFPFPRSLLASFLFFLTFASGIGPQYFVMPIALAAMFPTRWFLFYTTAVSFFLVGHHDELYITFFEMVTYDMVWIFTFLWFVDEIKFMKKYAKIK